jgi:hypothetical protein
MGVVGVGSCTVLSTNVGTSFIPASVLDSNAGTLSSLGLVIGWLGGRSMSRSILGSLPFPLDPLL